MKTQLRKYGTIKPAIVVRELNSTIGSIKETTKQNRDEENDASLKKRKKADEILGNNSTESILEDAEELRSEINSKSQSQDMSPVNVQKVHSPQRTPQHTRQSEKVLEHSLSKPPTLFPLNSVLQTQKHGSKMGLEPAQEVELVSDEIRLK